MKFLLYSEDPANAEPITVLKNIFADTGISVVKFGSRDLHNGILRERDTAGFCLPGIRGEVSHYTDQIGETGLKEMSLAIHEGRLMLAICAGAYFICKKTIYDPSWMTRKSRTPANPIFNGLAKGPVPSLGRPYNPEYWPSTLAPSQVTYKSENERWQHATVLYGNGPAFYPDNPDDPNLEPLAFYSNTAENPLAAASLTHGAGKILLLGVLPHMEYETIRDYKTINPLRGTKRMQMLMDHMKPHEPERQKFMNMLGNRIIEHTLTYRQKFSI